MELRFPAPCLVVLIGASGAGKTTWAREYFRPGEVVSSDALRAMVGAGEDDQTASTAAFDILERIVAERLRRGLTTVIDTTGLDAEDRVRWATMAHEAGIPAYAVVFDTPAAVCETRNRTATHPVPVSVLRRQLGRVRAAIDQITSEPFDAVHAPQPAAAVAPVLTMASPPPEPATGHTFGLLVSRFDWGDGDRGEQLASVARRAETAGFRDLWVMDHFRQIQGVGRPWEDLPEAYTALAFVAGVTSRIKMGALVAGVTHRHPVVLGKMVATLDALSGGRAICGLGIGWDRAEHDSYGIDFPPVTTRYDILEDTLRMLPLLWGKGSPRFEGRTFSAAELVCYPRPVQKRIPILVGGSGERRTLRLVAGYADACNLFGTPEVVEAKVDVLRRHCSDLGRDPGDIEVTHLLTVLNAGDRRQLIDKVDRLRGRNVTPESYARRVNAGTVADHVSLFARYRHAGAGHSIVSLPDVSEEGSIESFAEVIERMRVPSTKTSP
ncbi:MAG: TIGR03560 family F420-dependent LLM class oxidoreductase [Actinobacteria bacterium]|nr:TIGR03560 family F420-dependent LLM class oxidoreductase [Actinomycetota bacterium]